MANIVVIRFSLFYLLTWVQRCCPRATPDFGSVSVISSLLFQDIPWHPNTRLFEVREAFKRSLLLDFQARIRAYNAIFSPPADLREPSGGPPGGTSAPPCGGLATRPAFPVALRATDAEPLINALVQAHDYAYASCYSSVPKYNDSL